MLRSWAVINPLRPNLNKGTAAFEHEQRFHFGFCGSALNCSLDCKPKVLLFRFLPLVRLLRLLLLWVWDYVCRCVATKSGFRLVPFMIAI